MRLLSFKSTSALALALIAGGVVATATPVSADQTKTTTATVEFTAGTIDIVDPDHPNDPMHPAVPSFDFGTQDITTDNKTYNAVTAGTLTVSDLRGTGAGWNVTVTQQAQLKTAANDELTGAVLKLTNATTSNSYNETVNFTAADLTPGTASRVFDAPVNNGNGTSRLKFADASSDAQLEVPGSTVKKAAAYTAILEWTLTDSPA